jgi:hypothetical protein
MRVRLGLRLGLGGGSPSRSVLASRSVDTQKTKFFIRARPLCRNQQIKNSAVRHAEPLVFSTSESTGKI